MTLKLQLTNFQNVGPGNTATLTCPTGTGAPTYDQIKFELQGGLTPAHIESVRGKINGRIFLDEASGTIINKRDDYRGIFTDPAYVVLDFTEPKARNGALEQLVASIPGQLCQLLTFEVKLAANAPANGRIRAVANYRPPTTNAFIRKMFNTTASFSVAGSEGAPNIVYLPVGQAGGQIKRVWVHESAPGVILGAEIRIANNVVSTVTRAQMENDQKRNLLVPQAGIFVIDFIEDGNLAGRLDTQKTPQVELRLVTSAGAAYSVYYELIDPIGNL